MLDCRDPWGPYGANTLAVMNSQYWPALEAAIQQRKAGVVDWLAHLIAGETGLSYESVIRFAEREAH